MKKTLLVVAVFVVAAPLFAQTEKQKATDKKVVDVTKTTAKKEVKKEVKKAVITAKTGGETPKAIVPANVEQVKAPVETTDQRIAPATLSNATPVTPAQTTPPPAPLMDPNKDFTFKNDAYDFGKIPAGKPAKYDLFITNNTKEVTELTLVQPGCGCTTPEYEQNKKFGPGESVKVTLGYNGGAPGNGSAFSKSVTVTLKGYQPKVVTFRGETYSVPTESAPANGAIDKLKPAEETKH